MLDWDKIALKSGFKLLSYQSGKKSKLKLLCTSCNKEVYLHKTGLVKRVTKYCRSCMSYRRGKEFKKENTIVRDNIKIIKYLGTDSHSKHKYIFECFCGKEFTARYNNVVYGKTSSCGCVKRSRNSKKRIPLIDSILNNRIRDAKSRMGKKGLKYNLKRCEFRNLILQSCQYCNSSPCNEYTKGDEVIKVNGIDRIDSTKGYTIDNVVSCCETCNRMKRHLSADEFLSHIEKIYKFNK